MPNFTQIGQTVKISIRYEYIYFVLYILDFRRHHVFVPYVTILNVTIPHLIIPKGLSPLPQ